jgi:ATPase subunit of ABC transporter with duplicated ATPase domains
LLYEEVNLLILDEPTNHLDIDAIETLEEALENFKGTIFFISHDRYFINKIAKRVVAIEKGKLVSYDGNYNDYRNELQKRQDQMQVETVKVEPIKKKEKRSEPDEAVIKQRAIDKIEKEIGYLEFDLAQIEAEMVECGDDYIKLGELYEQKNQKQEALEALWESMLE